MIICYFVTITQSAAYLLSDLITKSQHEIKIIILIKIMYKFIIL